MSDVKSLPELVAAARGAAKGAEDRISRAQGADLAEAVTALEVASVDVFTLFEARMQHHFKRGPFSRKLTAKLKEAGQPDLADRIHQYYLAVNVLKHGKGASHRALLAAPSALFDVRASDDDGSLIDVTRPGFFDGLTTAILEAYAFLEAN